MGSSGVPLDKICFEEGCILEGVVAGGPSSVLPLAVDHLQRSHSDHTGRVVVL